MPIFFSSFSPSLPFKMAPISHSYHSSFLTIVRNEMGKRSPKGANRPQTLVHTVGHSPSPLSNLWGMAAWDSKESGFPLQCFPLPNSYVPLTFRNAFSLVCFVCPTHHLRSILKPTSSRKSAQIPSLSWPFTSKLLQYLSSNTLMGF